MRDHAAGRDLDVQVWSWETVADFRERLHDETQRQVFLAVPPGVGSGTLSLPPHPPPEVGQLTLGGIPMELDSTFGEHDVQPGAELYLSYESPFQIKLRDGWVREHTSASCKCQAWVWPQETMAKFYARVADHYRSHGVLNLRARFVQDASHDHDECGQHLQPDGELGVIHRPPIAMEPLSDCLTPDNDSWHTFASYGFPIGFPIASVRAEFDWHDQGTT